MKINADRTKTLQAMAIFYTLCETNTKGHVTLDYYGNKMEITAYYDIPDECPIYDRESIETTYQNEITGIIEYFETADGNKFQTLRFIVDL